MTHAIEPATKSNIIRRRECADRAPFSPQSPDPDATVLAYWLLYCRAPGRSTAPGEIVDLGQIGTDREKDWERLTPYSLARRTK